MTRSAPLAILLLIAPLAHADGVAVVAAPGQAISAAWNDVEETILDATEGTGNNAGIYAIQDSELVTAGLDAGTYTVRFYAEAAASVDPETDTPLTSFVAQHRWSGTVTLPEQMTLAEASIATSTFVAGAIDAAAIGADAIGSSEIATGAIDTSALAASSITATSIATDAITAAKIAADSIGASELAADSITSSEVGTGAIDTTALATGAITTSAFAAGAIDAAAVATDAIGSAELAANAINVSEMPLLPATTIAAADDVETSGGTPVSADIVDDSRTWFATEYRARNIVTVGDNFAGALALQPDLNPGTTISTVNSVSITGAATVTATGLTVNRAKTRAQFTVPTLTTTGTYTVVVTVTTIDGQTIPTTATLKVQ